MKRVMQSSRRTVSAHPLGCYCSGSHADEETERYQDLLARPIPHWNLFPTNGRLQEMEHLFNARPHLREVVYTLCIGIARERMITEQEHGLWEYRRIIPREVLHTNKTVVRSIDLSGVIFQYQSSILIDPFADTHFS